MTTKDEFVDRISGLPGVGRKNAEQLYEAGFTDIEALKRASREDLMKVKGIGPKSAEAVLRGLAELEAPAAKQEIEVVEKGGAARAEVVEPEAVYRPKAKPTLDAETKRLLGVREQKKAKQPYFRRYHWYYAASVPESWRFPHGTLNKQRRGFQYRAPRVRVGYRKPAAVRGLHPSGFAEVLVHNVKEVGLVTDPTKQAIRIAGGVGARKRRDIMEAAGAKNIRVLNPGKVTK